MQDFLVNFGNWLQNTAVGLWVSGTVWGYPYVQLTHFLGLSLWVGTIVIVDLRLLGLVGGRQTASQLAEQLAPLKWAGLGIAATGGLLLFSGLAETYVQNPAFLTKLPLLLLGIGYHVVIQRKMPQWGESMGTPPLAKVAGFTELLLWIGVIFAATEIPSY
ncbi:MAG: hypothetical protein O7A06_05765 [Acidobacteria bacterium]|nr:hypothetical protein [Acidobacteriota bacterium]MCZ6752820.1 hypothetical protein [Acidobacteriota bacterium]